MYGISSSSMTGTLVASADSTGSASGSFSATLDGLSSSTTYWYQAYVKEYNESTSSVEIRTGSVLSFTTAASNVPTGWLELPAYSVSGMSGTTTSSLGDLYNVTHSVTAGSATQRNYTILYDPEMYASYWAAYPLCHSHQDGTGRSDSWAYDPDVPQSKQTNLTAGAYGVSVSSDNYSSNYYARGHQVPNADRNGSGDMCSQTYYMTNLTPQIQNGFNGGIWASLEGAVRGLVSSDSASADTVYVVTGAAFRKKTDGTETITTITNTRDGKVLPVPNYYWKALLKVSWSGKEVTAASAVGFWLPHKEITSGSYADYVVSVDQIEEWTGFDLFANLPPSLQAAAESNVNWIGFTSF